MEVPPAGYVNLRNGLYSVRTRCLEPHRPDLLTPFQFNVRFDPAADCPNIRRFCSEVLPADTPFFLAEALALCMMPDNPADQSVMLRGSGGNGKSVLLDVLTAALDRANVSAVELQELVDDRFAIADLYMKVANIAADISSDHLARTGPFKALVTGDEKPAQFKFRPAFSFRSYAKLFFSANKTPHSEDDSEGFFRRWYGVSFERRFDDSTRRMKRSTLVAQLTTQEELSGLFNWALERWDQVAEYGLTETESTRQARDQFRMESNPLLAWIRDNTIADAEGEIPCGDLLKAYNRYAKDNDLRGTSAKALGALIRTHFPLVKMTRGLVSRWGFDRPKVYRGLGWGDRAEVQDEVEGPGPSGTHDLEHAENGPDVPDGPDPTTYTRAREVHTSEGAQFSRARVSQKNGAIGATLDGAGGDGVPAQPVLEDYGARLPRRPDSADPGLVRNSPVRTPGGCGILVAYYDLGAVVSISGARRLFPYEQVKPIEPQ